MTLHLKPTYQPEIFGDVQNKSYPAPAEMLHLSIAHSGPGIDDLVRFYQIVLNMRFVYKISYPAFEFIALSHDDENHRIGILNNLTDNNDALAISQGVDLARDVATGHADEPRKAPLRQCRIEHSSWRYERFEDVLITAKRVHEELGQWPRSSRLQHTDITIDYNDPDGNRVELLTQYSSKAQILRGLERAFSRTETQQEQSYGDIYQAFNMEKMIAMFERGEPVANLRNKAWVKEKVAEGVL